MRFLVVPLLAAALSAPAGPAVAAERPLSHQRPVTASGALPGHRAAQAVDGGAGTAWVSGTTGGTPWLRVDLGAYRAVDRVWLSWGPAYARGYHVQTSADGASWHTVRRVTDGDGRVDYLTGLAASGRYVRVVGTGPATPHGLALYEFRVYGATGLADPATKELAMRLVSSAENSTLDWRAQYGYLEDIGDGRGWTGGIVGFCSGTSDMLGVVELYTRRKPGNVLARFLPALRRVDGTASRAGLGAAFVTAWKQAAADPVFRRVQDDERDRLYFDPAVRLARADGLRALGQFAYYDAAVMHGYSGLLSVRRAAVGAARTPAGGGGEPAYLEAYLDARVAEMRTEEAHSDTSRVDTAQRVFLRAGNLDLRTPLVWKVYGDLFTVP